MERSHMDVPYAVERASGVMPAIVGAIYSKVDIHELGDMSRVLSVSERYAELVMERWSYTDITPIKRKEIVTQLVRGFPTHGFLIDFEQAQTMGLKVERLNPASEELCRLLLETIKDDQQPMLAIPNMIHENNQETDHQNENEHQVQEVTHE